MHKFAPDHQLTAIVDNWNDYYIARTKAVLDGTWKSEDVWGGFAAKMVEMAPYTNLADDILAEAKKTTADIESGKLKPFDGPIRKQDGTEVIGAGDSLSDEVLLGMNYYVEGVEGELPQ